jgi:hypothetical protein
MTYLRTVMPAWERYSAYLGTLMHTLIAIGVRLDFLTAIADLGHNLKARRAVPCVTFNGASVTTSIIFLASILTSRYWGLAKDGRVNLGLSARAGERLG